MMPFLLLGALFLVGAALTGVRAAFSLSDHATMVGGVVVVAVMAVGAVVFLAIPGGAVTLTADSLSVERRFRPAIVIPTAELQVETHHWLARTRELTDMSSGMQLRVSGGGQTAWIGASGARVAEAARADDAPGRTQAPHAVLAEEDFLSLRSALEER